MHAQAKVSARYYADPFAVPLRASCAPVILGMPYVGMLTADTKECCSNIRTPPFWVSIACVGVFTPGSYILRNGWPCWQLSLICHDAVKTAWEYTYY